MPNTLFIHYPTSSAGGSTGVQTYATFADLPATAPNGTLAVVLDTDTLYVFSTGSMMWIPLNASGNYMVNVFTLTPTDITNKFVVLSQSPTVAADTALTVIDGPMQEFGNDFTVSGSTLSWAGLFLDGVLVAGDELIVQFN